MKTLRRLGLWDSIGLTIGGLGALMVVIVALVLVGVFLLARTGCRQTGDTFDQPVVFRVLAGCFVEDEAGQMVPVDQYRRFEEVRP